MGTNAVRATGAYLSPLRYPGGKRKLANFVKLMFVTNDLVGGEYAEPYAGGAGIALALLFDQYVRAVHINDLDRAVYAFWHSVLNASEGLCRLIQNTPITPDEWHRQKDVQDDPDASMLALGFSTFFLNRTNRSGIIGGGMIGGERQAGDWKLDARFTKPDLVRRIRRIAKHRQRIHLSNMDASDFMSDVAPALPEDTLCYLDPPYYAKGRRELYANSYEPRDHGEMADLVRTTNRPWIVSYNDVPEVRTLYQGFRRLNYVLSYSVRRRYKGDEVMFFSHDLRLPNVSDPVRLTKRDLAEYLV